MNDIQKLQECILSIACEIQRICEDNDIQYFMSGGTMLGAIRHNGFIPWDDDFDFVMPRNSYEKFLKVAPKELDLSKYFLQTMDSDLLYARPFAKVRLNGTKLIEQSTKDVEINQGIFVDIFPLDKIPKNWIIERAWIIKCKILAIAIWKKCGYKTPNVLYSIIGFAFSPFDLLGLKKKLSTCCKKYKDSSAKEYLTLAFSKQRYKKCWLNNLVYYQFENKAFPGIADYDDYLTSQYGDYMELPPIEERQTHTSVPVDYGQYE